MKTTARRGATPAPGQVRRRRYLWVLVAVGAIVGAVSGLAVASMRPADFESTGTAFVAFSPPRNQQDPFSALQFVTQRIATYAELGRSPEVLQAVANDVGLPDGAELSGKLTVAAVPGTVMLRISAVDADRATSLRLADSLMTNLSRAAVAVEAGGSGGESPISLVAVQPPLASPASTLTTDALAAVVGLVIGALLGALAGRLLPKSTATAPVTTPTMTPTAAATTAPILTAPGRARHRTHEDDPGHG